MNKLLRLCVAAAAVVLTCSSVGAAVQLPKTHDKVVKPDPDAVAVATAWLALVDRGDYSAAFQRYPARIRAGGAIVAQNSIASFHARRTPLGAMRSRKLLRARFSHTLPGTPDGNYEFLDFGSSFARKADALEIITLTKESGHWQVSGYHMR